MKHTLLILALALGVFALLLVAAGDKASDPKLPRPPNRPRKTRSLSLSEIDRYYAAGRPSSATRHGGGGAGLARRQRRRRGDDTQRSRRSRQRRRGRGAGRCGPRRDARAAGGARVSEDASPVAGRRFTRSSRNSGGREALGDDVPGDDVPPRVDVVGPAVLVLEVVGVLPDVDATSGTWPLERGLSWLGVPTTARPLCP